MKYKYIYLLIIFIFALLSAFYLNKKEGYENMNTSSLKDDDFKSSFCGNIISYSGSNGCPLLSNDDVLQLLTRGNNSNTFI